MSSKIILPMNMVKLAEELMRATPKIEGMRIDELTDDGSEISGPWEHEPDKAMIEHAGYVCELIRHPVHKTWLGYVYVGEEHPLYRNVDEDDTFDYLDVHGGVTYKGDGKFGFDCNHAGDMSPMFGTMTNGPAEYRTLEYATDEVKRLAQQLRNYDSAYHRRAFDMANKLEHRAAQIRDSLKHKE